MTEADVALSGVVPASGTVTLTVRPSARQNWVVKQVSPAGPDVGGGATGALYRDTYLISPFVPQADAIAGDPPVPLRNGQALRIVWTGAVPGAAVSALVLYDDGN